MADEKKTRRTGANQKVQVKLDDSGMETQYANFANVSGSREEIMVDFGMSSVHRGKVPSVSIKVGKRIVLNPHTAKRLALLMNQAMTQYESKFGPIDIGAAPAAPDITPSAEEVKKPN